MSEGSDGLGEWLSKPLPLPLSSLDRLIEVYKGHDCSISNIIGSVRDANKKQVLEGSLKGCLEAFTSIIDAYKELAIERNALSAFAGKIIPGPNSFSLEDIKETIVETLRENSESLPVNQDGLVPVKSYASIVSHGANNSKPCCSENVNLLKRQVIPIKKTVSFFVGPQKANLSKFNSHDDVKNALFNAVKPADLNLRVSKIYKSSGKNLRIEATGVDLGVMSESRAIASAGLEVVEETKLNPRLLVKDIPCDLTPEEIMKCIVNQNLVEGDSAGVKLVYLFPKRDRRFTSCIIEVSPEIRRRLLRNDGVYIDWSSCRVNDYVSVLQCYRCLRFGHLAKNCRSKDVHCGHCGKDHEIKDCDKRREEICCYNCREMKHGDIQHTSFDALNCPILARRVEDKTRRINYG